MTEPTRTHPDHLEKVVPTYLDGRASAFEEAAAWHEHIAANLPVYCQTRDAHLESAKHFRRRAAGIRALTRGEVRKPGAVIVEIG